MATTTPSQTLENVDKLHTQLTAQLTSLRKALNHWQTQELDYESIREELAALPETADTHAITTALDAAGCESISRADLTDILRLDASGNVTRNPSQISGLIARRVDYVSRNAETLTKQIAALESKLENVEEVRRAGFGVTHEEGEAVMDIQEELDEEGNVIGSRVGVPKEAAGDLLDVLGKLGVSEEAGDEDGEKDEVEEQAKDKGKGKVKEVVEKQKASEAEEGWTYDQATSVRTVGKKPTADSAPVAAPARQLAAQPSKSATEPARKKSVTFAPETKSDASNTKTSSQPNKLTPEPASAPVPSASTSHALSNSTLRGQRFHLSSDSPLLNPPTTSTMASAAPPIQLQESAEDAALRAEMLRYTMDENRAVVAQMDLLDDEASDDSSYWSDGTIEEWGDDVDENAISERARRRALERGEGAADLDDEEEEENEHGISLKSHITDDLRNEMRALEEKLMAQGLLNAGPGAAIPSGDEADDGPEDGIEEGERQAASQTKILRIRSDSEETPTLNDGPAPDAELWGDDPRILDLLDRGPAPKEKEDEKAASTAKATATTTKNKGVRFAPDLDIAPAPDVSSTSSTPIVDLAPKPASRPVAPAVIERKSTPGTAVSPSSASQAAEEEPKRQSRFKAARQNQAQSQPLSEQVAQPGKPLADTVLERPASNAPRAPGGRDPAILQRDLALQRRDVVNRIVERQGGYLSQEVAEDVEEEERVEGKRVSRFKAARLRG